MTLQETAERLLTWLDIERVLKQHSVLWSQLPEHILSVDCFADGMEIRHCADDGLVVAWLSEIFGHAYLQDARCIRLRIGDTPYPVELVRESADARPAMGRSYPLWRDVTYLPADESAAAPSVSGATNMPPEWVGGPDLVSFHSFKGGVGRTTSLMTYVAACMQEPRDGARKILVVDADLEAPGVSFWLDEVNRPTVSFVQLLEALHYPPAGLEKTLEFFANELRKTSVSVGSRLRELFVLPAALDLGEIQDMPVAPEHLARNPANPWQLSDHLRALGQRLGVDAVFVDLRAGLSELASPILFDSRVDHFFVSTVAPQSVRGMAEVLHRLYAFNRQLPAAQRETAKPTVVLSMLTKELREAGHYDEALKALDTAYPGNLDVDALTPGVQWLEAEFQNNLMSIGTLREALELLSQPSALFSSASEWARALYSAQEQDASAGMPDVAEGSVESRQQRAKRLHEVCRAAEFADSSAESRILATEPLLNLGKHYSRELPNILMIGAKGAGKTFTFRQLVNAGSWQQFLSKLGFLPEQVTDAAIFPVLWSENISDKPGGEIKLAQGRALDLIQADRQQLLTGSIVQRRIRDALASPPAHWDDFWDDLVAEQFGLSGGGLSAVNQRLAADGARAILVFDGIEDAFKDASEVPAADAIRALLRLPNRIAELDQRYLGVVVFVRADYVQATIEQNLGQLLQRFQPFRLQWNPESFLRLAFMLSCQAGVLDDDPASAESLRVEELKNKLERLWGKKLGSEKSKEAHSARWVYAALCDLKGNVQARDLVRFLKFAALRETGKPGLPNRLLAPESMRSAIPECSAEKVNEAKSEMAPLKRWIELLDAQGSFRPKVPFSREQACLDSDSKLLGALQEIGVIYEDLDGKLGDVRLFLPEIYRHGLGFETSATGRPRTQALLKKNIGAIPL